MPDVRKRLAYFVSRYPAVSHTFILREVQALQALGWTIDTASLNDPDQDTLPQDEAAAAATTYYVKRDGLPGALRAHAYTLWRHPAGWLRGLRLAFRLGGSDLHRLLRSFTYFTGALMVGHWMARRQQQHLHVHFATAGANFGLYAKEVFDCGLSLTIHGPDEFANVDAEWLREKIGAADFVLCIGQYARSQLMRLMQVDEWHKFHIAPLGVDTAHYAPGTALAAATNPTGLAIAVTSPFRLLCVGRLTPAKGQHVLVKAMQALRAEGRAVQLTLVGTGPDESSLREAVSSGGLAGHVHFTGALDQATVRTLYRDTDLFVLPSFAEGIPVVLMEAMAMGVPCVSTAINGIPELIRTGEDGLLVMPADLDALVRAIATLMDDPQLRRRLAEQGRARVMARYDLHTNTAHLANVLHEQLQALAA